MSNVAVIVLFKSNLEYILRMGQDAAQVYTKYCTIINELLNPKGRYFITSCHGNDKYNPSNSLFDYSLDYLFHGYFLLAGNDGRYPFGRDGFSKYANQVGLKTIFQEERTNDYLISMNLAFSYFQTYDGANPVSFSIPSLTDALVKTIAGPYYIHTYLCYLATQSYVWTPFLWEFVPEEVNGKWIPPVTLQYIMFEKERSYSG